MKTWKFVFHHLGVCLAFLSVWSKTDVTWSRILTLDTIRECSIQKVSCFSSNCNCRDNWQNGNISLLVVDSYFLEVGINARQRRTQFLVSLVESAQFDPKYSRGHEEPWASLCCSDDSRDHELLLHPTSQSHRAISEPPLSHVHVPSEGRLGGDRGFLCPASAMASAPTATQVSLAQRDGWEDVTKHLTTGAGLVSLLVLHLFLWFCFGFFSVQEAASDMPLITKEDSA